MTDYNKPPAACPGCGCSHFVRHVRLMAVEHSLGGEVAGLFTTKRAHEEKWSCDRCGRVHRMPAAEFKRLLAEAVGDPTEMIDGWIEAGPLPAGEPEQA